MVKNEKSVTVHSGVFAVPGNELYIRVVNSLMGHAVAQWLRHCATNWKVTGSIPDGAIGIFH